MPIKAITLDIGGTILGGGLRRETYRGELLRYFSDKGFEIDPSTLRKANKSMLARLDKLRKKNLEPRFDELYARLLEDLGINPSKEILNDIWDLYVRSFEFYVLPRVPEVLEELKRYYKLAAISNTISGAAKLFLIECGLIRFFDEMVLSCDLGVRKPDRRIFEFVLKRLGLGAPNVVHVGDSARDDVDGAKVVGMKALWIKRGETKPTRAPDGIVSSIDELPKAVKELDC